MNGLNVPVRAVALAILVVAASLIAASPASASPLAPGAGGAGVEWIEAGAAPGGAVPLEEPTPPAPDAGFASSEADFTLQAATFGPYKSVAIPESGGPGLGFDAAGLVLVTGTTAVFVYNSSGLYLGRLEFPRRITGLTVAGGSVLVTTDHSVGSGQTYRLASGTLQVTATYPGGWSIGDPNVSGDLVHFSRGSGAFGTLQLSTGLVTEWTAPPGDVRAIPNSTRLIHVGSSVVSEYDASSLPPSLVTSVPTSNAVLRGVAADGTAVHVSSGTPSVLERVPLPLGSGAAIALSAGAGVDAVHSTTASGGWDTVLSLTSAAPKLSFFRPGETTPAFESVLPGSLAVGAWNASGTQFAVATGVGAERRLLLYAAPGTNRPQTPFSGSAGEYTGVTPTRVLDTRDGLGAPAGPLSPGATIDVQVTGLGAVPATGVSAVAVNLTGVLPSAETYLSVFPTSGTVPFVSNLNLVPGAVRPNLAIVRVGAGGRITVFNAEGSTHVVADVQGYFSTREGPGGGRFHSLSPTRFLDTRDSAPLRGGDTVAVPVGGVGGVPAGATAVAMTVIGIARTSDTYVTVYPSDAVRPHASTINARGLETASNLVYSRIGADGSVLLYNASGLTNLVVDVVGYWDGDRSTEAGRYVPFSEPFRYADTRVTRSTLQPGTVSSLRVAGYPATDPVVPLPRDGAGTIVYNLTATNNRVGGYLTVYPAVAGLAPPHASSINFYGFQTVAILAVTGYGEDGAINFYNPAGATDAIVDVMGFYTSASF